MSKEELFYMPSDAGRKFEPQISGARIKQLIEAGELRAFKTVGGVHLIAESELRRFLASRKERIAAE